MSEANYIITIICIISFLEWLAITIHLQRIEGLLEENLTDKSPKETPQK